MNIYSLSYKNLRRNKLRNAGAIIRISFGVIVLLTLVSSGIGIETFLEGQSEVVNSILNQSIGFISYLSTYINSVLGTNLTSAEFFEFIRNILENIVNFLDLIASLIFLVGIFGVINVMNLNLVERKPEIALLKVMGFTDIQIIASFLLEASLLGFIGAVIGTTVVILGITLLSSIIEIELFQFVMPLWLPFIAIFTTTVLSALIVVYAVCLTIKEDSLDILRIFS